MLPDHIILGHGYELGRPGRQNSGKVLEISGARGEIFGTGSCHGAGSEQQPTSRGNSWGCHGGQECRGLWRILLCDGIELLLRVLSDQSLPCPLSAPCSRNCTHSPELCWVHGAQLRVSLQPGLSPTPPEFPETPISPRMQGGQGGC